MAVVRVSKDYVVMATHHLKEREMSLKAKGLLSLMLAIPNDLKISTESLVSLSKDGKDSVTAALHELERLGYVSHVMRKNEKGQYAGCEYIVHDIPLSMIFR